MATVAQTPTPLPDFKVAGKLLEDLESSVQSTQQDFLNFIKAAARLRAKYEDLQRQLKENPSKEAYDALMREKEECEKKVQELQAIADNTSKILSGDLKVSEILNQVDYLRKLVQGGLGEVLAEEKMSNERGPAVS